MATIEPEEYVYKVYNTGHAILENGDKRQLTADEKSIFDKALKKSMGKPEK